MKNDAGNYQKPNAKEIVWKWNEKTFGETGKTLMQKRLGLY